MNRTDKAVGESVPLPERLEDFARVVQQASAFSPDPDRPIRHRLQGQNAVVGNRGGVRAVEYDEDSFFDEGGREHRSILIVSTTVQNTTGLR